MKLSWDALGPEGLRFFGRVNASATHEIKNSLAVINENAGLLEDLLRMAERGAPLDQARVAGIAGRVRGQVGKADAVIKSLNTFAHTVDEPVRSVDLGEALDLAVRLHSRLAAMKETELECVPCKGEVEAVTMPFQLENLLSLCIAEAVIAAGPGGKVSLRAVDSQTGPEVRLSWTKDAPCALPAGAGADALAQALQSEMANNPGQLVLRLPRRLAAPVEQ